MKQQAFLLGLVGIFMALPAGAAPGDAAGMDCPLARQPYSSQTILADLLVNPATKAIVDRDAPDLTSALTRGRSGGSLPSGFANIITPEWLLGMRPGGAAVAAKLEDSLAKVPLTDEAILARCARYDRTPPSLPAVIERPAILVFDKITGYRDALSVDAATAALKAMASRRGWTLVFSDNGAVFNARDLARFDAAVWNNVSGDALTVPQQEAFKAWLDKGGGFAGFHGSAGDPVYVWDWYADTLIGARFVGHPMDPQFQAARVVVEDPAHPIARGLPPEWTMTEEWYSFAASPRLKGAHILATLDENSYSPKGFGGRDLRMGDHPIAWAKCIGDGRSFYSAIGHRPESYSEPNGAKLLEQGIAWAAGLGDTRCAGGRESGNAARPADASPISSGGKYVAMGSSFAAGAGLTTPADPVPGRCGRSADNYAHQLARKRSLQLVDVSCGGATTAHLLGPWNELSPQLDAITPDTRLVTVTIGGNDVGYILGLFSAVCPSLDPASRAKARVDRCPTPAPPTDQALTDLELALRGIAAEVRRRAPEARLVFVDYLTILPEQGVCPALPISDREADDSRKVALRLATVTAKVANETRTDLIRASELSRDHDACAQDPWTNGFPHSEAPLVGAPFHPNLKGMTAVADALDRLLP